MLQNNNAFSCFSIRFFTFSCVFLVHKNHLLPVSQYSGTISILFIAFNKLKHVALSVICASTFACVMYEALVNLKPRFNVPNACSTIKRFCDINLFFFFCQYDSSLSLTAFYSIPSFIPLLLSNFRLSFEVYPLSA